MKSEVDFFVKTEAWDIKKIKNDVIDSLEEVRGSKYDSYVEVSRDDLDILERKFMCTKRNGENSKEKCVTTTTT